MVHHGQAMKTSSSPTTDENAVSVGVGLVIVARARILPCGHRLNRNKRTVHDNQ